MRIGCTSSKSNLIAKLLAAVTMLLALTPVFASTIEYTAPEAPQAPRTIDELIHDSALKYGVSESVMRTVIRCESGFRPNAIGDHGHSFGLVQIYLPAWPSITREQALDPEFAVEFLAQKLSNQQGYLWTCHRLLVK